MTALQTRLTMVRSTEHFSDAAVFSDVTKLIKVVEHSEGEALGKLFYLAYHGTVDDEGGSQDDAITEAVETLAGKYGDLIQNASFIAFDDSVAVCATVVTAYKPLGTLLAFCVTHPNYQRRGLAKFLLRKSIDVLHESGITQLRLVVTEANASAVKLYESLGFAEESRHPSGS